MAVGAILGYLFRICGASSTTQEKRCLTLAPLISTIGVSIFLESLALLLWGPQTRSFPPDYIGGLIDFGAFKISMGTNYWFRCFCCANANSKYSY